MYRYVVLLYLLGCACATSRPVRSPVAVLYEDEPWSRGFVASRTPAFALYDDGLVIYETETDHPVPRYASFTLDANGLERLRRVLRRALGDHDVQVSLSEMPHHPFNVLHVWRSGKRTTGTVYGSLGPRSEFRAECPAAFLEAFDAARRFRHDGAAPWQPDTLLVQFSESEMPRSPRAAKPWPADWPDGSHRSAVQAGAGFRVLLDSRHLAELAALWDHPGNSHAEVIAGGRHWLVSYSIPLPCHETWDGWPSEPAERR